METAPMTEVHKIILKPEIHMLSWVMLKKHSNGEDSAQKGSIRKWNRFCRHTAQGNAERCTCVHKQVDSFALGPTLEPLEELLNL